MNRREFIKYAAFTAWCSARQRLLPLSAAPSEKKSRCNFIFILADDFGWSQLGCYGSGYYQTPNIDRLAREGMRFTDAYAAGPVCSPTRASIMTGKYPARLHLTDFIAGSSFPYEQLQQPNWQKHLPLEEVTIAEMLNSAGYVTASFGKWHLSIAKKPPQSAPYDPDKQGFDEVIITEKPASNQNSEKDAHNVDLITEKSLAFLDKNKDKPFFLYVAHNVVHDPVMGKKTLIAKYKSKPDSQLPENNPVLAAMIEDLDDSVGGILKKLEELKIADKTIVVFFSDNGGLEKSAKQTPLRSGKANLYEGGIRVPLIVRWPGVVKVGSTCDEPVISVDFFPTILDILSLRNTTRNQLDGVSILPLLRQTGGLGRQAIYWHYPHYHSAGLGPSGAVRAGDYKLIEWFDKTICGAGDEFELYDLRRDIGEQKNLAKELPQKVGELSKALADWRRRVGAQMMTPNPGYDPDKAKKSKSLG